MTEMLDDAELSNLLQTINVSTEGEVPVQTLSSDIELPTQEGKQQGIAKPYDFKRPDKFSKGYRARIRNHGHSCFLCEIVIRSQFHTTYEPEHKV
jgi:hypothetical protein